MARLWSVCWLTGATTLMLYACSATNDLFPPTDDDSSSGQTGGGGAVPIGGMGGAVPVGGAGGAGGGSAGGSVGGSGGGSVGGAGGSGLVGGAGGTGGGAPPLTPNCNCPVAFGLSAGGAGGAGGTSGAGGAGGAGGTSGAGGAGGAVGGAGGAGGAVSCAPPANNSAPHYVDPLGTDSIATHGGGPGACALQTIPYALTLATNEVHVSADTYNVTGSPITVSGTQHLICDSAGGTTLSGQPLDVSASVTMKLTGNGSRASHCNIMAAAQTGYCIKVTGDNVILDKLTIANCGGAAITVNGDAATITNCVINHIATNVFFMQPKSATISGNEFHSNTVDVKCNGVHDNPVGTNTISGSGNTHPGGNVTCTQ